MSTFPARIRTGLEQIAASVEILGPGLFRVGSGVPEMTVSPVTRYPNERTADPLVDALTTRLYRSYHCRAPAPVREVVSDDLLPALEAANASVERWDPGWEVVDCNEAGAVVVRSGGRIRLEERDRYRGPDDGPEPGAQVALSCPREDATTQPAFYFAFGETLGDRYEDLVGTRIYMRLRPGTAVRWMGWLTRTLNRYQVPFAFKVLRYPQAYRRIDTAVLYVSRRHAGFAAALVRDAAEALGGLGPQTPLFARRLVPGVGIADNPPGGESFGMARMRLVAEGLIAAWRAGAPNMEPSIAAIADRFSAAGINLRRPWLNPGNAEIAVAPRSPQVAVLRYDNAAPWLDVADRIGSRLVRDAVWSGDHCTWLGWFVVPEGGWPRVAFCAGGADLYAGTTGIALFLARLARLTGDRRQSQAARGGMRHALSRSARGAWQIGAYSGLAGILHGALAIGETLDWGEAIGAVPPLVQRLSAAPREDWHNDIMAGRAGAIRVLVDAAQQHAIDGTLDLAARLGDELIALAIRKDETWSWRTTDVAAERNILGYSHGTAGIAAALTALARATGERNFLAAAMGALNYEYAAFDPVHRNWPDFRPQARAPGSEGIARTSMVAWCNGAAGTTLALARLDRGDRDRRAEKHLDMAITTTAASLPPHAHLRGGDFCLCHGIAGNAEILLQIAELTGRADLRMAAVAAGEDGLERHHSQGVWPCGIEGGGETPGLLVGLAGIGHFYLRLHDSAIPSPLLL